MIISFEKAEKAFDIIQYIFMIKILSKLGIEVNFLIDKDYLQKNLQLTSYLLVRSNSKFFH